MKNTISIAIVTGLLLVMASCDTGKTTITGPGSGPSKALEQLREKYPVVPESAAFLDENGKQVYDILKKRYAENMAALNREATSIGAKLVVVVLTPEVGESITKSTREGIPYISEVCKANGIDLFDLSEKLATYTPTEIT